MRLYFSFAEISDYTKNRYGRSLGFEAVSERELRATFEQKVFIKTVSVSLNVKIEDVKADGLTLSYDGHLGMDTVVSGLLTLFKSFYPELAVAIIPEQGHRVRVELSELKQAENALKLLALEDIRVNEDGLTVVGRLKS